MSDVRSEPSRSVPLLVPIEKPLVVGDDDGACDDPFGIGLPLAGMGGLPLPGCDPTGEFDVGADGIGLEAGKLELEGCGVEKLGTPEGCGAGRLVGPGELEGGVAEVEELGGLGG